MVASSKNGPLECTLGALKLTHFIPMDLMVMTVYCAPPSYGDMLNGSSPTALLMYLIQAVVREQHWLLGKNNCFEMRIY